MAPAFSKIFTEHEDMIKQALPGGNPLTNKVKRYECCVCLEDKIHYPQDNRSVKCWTCKNTFTCAECCGEIQVIHSMWVAETRMTEKVRIPCSNGKAEDDVCGEINHHHGYGQSSQMSHKCPVCRTPFDDTFHEDITDWVELIRKEIIRMITKDTFHLGVQAAKDKFMEMILFGGAECQQARADLAVNAFMLLPNSCGEDIGSTDIRQIDGAYDILRADFKKGVFFTGRTDVRQGGLDDGKNAKFNC